MFIKLYFIALPVFFIIDMIWLGLIAKNFIRGQIGVLMNANLNWFAAILFYLLFIAGLVIFVLISSVENRDWLNALYMGALFGLFTYSTYDLTNLATLKDWSLLITRTDIIWALS